MNIFAARKQLHQISATNPQAQHVNFFEESNQDKLLKNKFKTPKTPNKQLYTQQAYNRFIKEESSRIIAEKNNKSQKVQVKTPHFKNNQVGNYSSTQKIRFQKLGLQSFLDQEIVQKKISHTEQPEEKRIIKNLNNTYFRTTEHVNAKRRNMINTLGIKKSSISNYNVEWNGREIDENEIGWKEFGYIPNKVFPCRKTSNVKSRIYTPKRNESSKAGEKKKLSEEKPIGQRSKIYKTSSAKLLHNKQIAAKTTKIIQTSEVLSLKHPLAIREMKSGVISSKPLNNSQQFTLKKQVENGLKYYEPLRPKSQARKRPLTSRDTAKTNQNMVNRLGRHRQQIRHSGIGNRSFHHFTQSASRQGAAENGIEILKNDDNYKNAGLIVGKRMNIHH